MVVAFVHRRNKSTRFYRDLPIELRNLVVFVPWENMTPAKGPETGRSQAAKTGSRPELSPAPRRDQISGASPESTSAEPAGC